MKKINLLFKVFIGCCLMLFSQQGMAQSHYKNEAEVKGVTTSGAYQITLSPHIIARCKDDLSDIRIVDQAGKPVPYILQKDLPINSRHTFIEFPISNGAAAKGQTSIIIRNENFTAIKTLCLQIRNNDVERSINIMGSDDNTEWYAISENIILIGSTNSNSYYEQCIPIPLSNYRFFQITVNGKNKTPLNILRAGIYTDDQVSGKYQQLTPPVISQKDSSGISHIKLKFDDNYVVNKLHLVVEGSKFYKRDVRCYAVDEHGSHFIASAQLNSNNPTDIMLATRAKQIDIEIFNQDNPALKVISADAYQLSQSLLSYLEANKKYHIAFGDTNAMAPNYDLGFFTDSLGKNLKAASLGLITLKTDHTVAQPAKPAFNFTYLMWGAITVILLILAFFTYKMTSEVKARNS